MRRYISVLALSLALATAVGAQAPIPTDTLAYASIENCPVIDVTFVCTTQVGTLDLTTGTFTPAPNSSSYAILDLALSPTGALYGLTSSSLLIIDPASGTISNTVSLSTGVSSLAFSTNGTLYALANIPGIPNALYTLDSASGQVTLVANVGQPLSSSSLGKIRFAGGILYVTDTATSATLYTISLSDGSVTQVGNTGSVPGNNLGGAASGALFDISATGSPSGGPQIYLINRTTGTATPGPATNAFYNFVVLAPVLTIGGAATNNNVSFPNQALNTTGPQQTVTVTNSGTSPLNFSSIILSDTIDFQMANDCVGVSIAIGASCNINIGFTPQTAGSFTATIGLTDNAGDSPQRINLSGTGVGVPMVMISPSNLTFPNQALNTGSASQVVTITSTGTASVFYRSVTIGGANPGDFQILSNSCIPLGTPILLSTVSPPSCSIALAFTPTSTGTRTATAIITDNAPNSPQVVSLTGTSTPLVTISSSTVSFGNQMVNTTSATQTVTLTNTGLDPLAISLIVTAGANPADFTLSNNCGQSLAAGAACNITIAFMPQATGARGAAINIVDNAPGSPQSIGLTGTGVQPAVTFTGNLVQNTLSFGNQTVNAPSTPPETITITNSGTALLVINGTPSVTGANSSDFQMTNNCGSSLAANASCSMSLTFTPSSTGTRTASIVIKDNAPDSPQAINLIGIAPDPPVVTLGPPVFGSPEQAAIPFSLSTSYPLASTGIIMLSFKPDQQVKNAPQSCLDTEITLTDGMKSDAHPCGSLSFSIDPNSTVTPPIMLQIGTISGTITISAQLQSQGQIIATPAAVPIPITPAPPVIMMQTGPPTAIAAGVQVNVAGYSNTLDVAEAAFTFGLATGVTMQPPLAPFPVSSRFDPYYAKYSNSAGGQFCYSQQFSVTGNAQDITSVAVTLYNSQMQASTIGPLPSSCVFNSAQVAVPVTGFILDAQAGALRAMIGMPGAAHLDAPVITNAQSASVAPDGSAALTVENGELTLYTGLRTAQPSPAGIGNFIAEADHFAWSPDSSAAAIYCAASGQAQIITGLRNAPAASAPIDLTALPGQVTAWAFDGQRIILGVTGATGGLWTVTAKGQLHRIANADGPAVIALVGADLYFADNQSHVIWQLKNYGATPASMLLAYTDSGSSIVGMQASADGQRLLAAERDTQKLLVYDVSSRTILDSLDLGFAPSRLDLFGSASVFLLRESGQGPAYVLSDGGPRNMFVYFVPGGSARERRAVIRPI